MATHILIVDDDPEVLQVTGAMLQKRGYEVSLAVNGLRALEKIKIQRPDLILADVLMPEMDGYTFYKELKNNPVTNNIPVLIITGRGKMEDSFKVMGVDGFISKPFSTEDLADEVTHILTIAKTKLPSAQAAIPVGSLKILAIGSDKAVLENMAFEARRAGFVFSMVNSGAEAISQAVKFIPDLVFLDVLLQDMASNEMVDILRRLPFLDTRPIIGYAYYDLANLNDPVTRQKVLRLEEVSQHLLQSGASDYIGRYNHHLFRKTILDFLQKRRKK